MVVFDNKSAINISFLTKVKNRIFLQKKFWNEKILYICRRITNRGKEYKMLTTLEIAHKIAEVNSPLSRPSVHALADILVRKKYKKGQIILQQGETCRNLLFVEKGLVRQFYYKNEKELTEHLGYEYGMIICIESYFKQEPTRLMVEALEPVILWELPKDKLDALIMEYPEVSRLYQHVLEHSLIESQVKADTLRFEPALERYVKLMQRHPEILKRAPLVHIASLLQMTPETLSRVRASLVNKE
jgi:CRP-like cAMP-binding protein